MIRLWKLGNIEHKICPTKEAVEKLHRILKSGDFTDIIWGPDIECQIIPDHPDELITDIITVNKERKKKALIFGVTGQDGSYLSELLLEKNYEVVGVGRRCSINTQERLKGVLDNPNFKYVEGDITDPSSVGELINFQQPNEVYNLAAQSHVGTSFKQPSTTFQIDAVGVLNILEAIRLYSPETRFYQASTSEQFGKNYTAPDKGFFGTDCEYKYQDENTVFAPQSPYAVAKVAAHHLVDLYRDAYGIHASAGILFNHETLTYNTPIIFKNKFNEIDILPIGDVARFHTGLLFDMSKDYQEGKPTVDLWVWDQTGWTKVKYISGYPHKGDKNPKIINSRNSVYAATGSHVCIMEDDLEVKTKDIKLGNRVKLIDLPKDELNETTVSLEEAEWLGMIVGDGHISNSRIRFTNKDLSIKKHFEYLWHKISDGSSVRYMSSKSGFTGEEIGQVECLGKYYRKIIDIYTDEITPFGHYTKKVPKCILNSPKDIQEAFLIGYNLCDGSKKNSCKYKFKNFKTNSHTLACGLLFLINNVTKQKFNITVEESWKWGKRQFYYSINLLSDSKTNIEKYNQIKKLRSQNLSISQREIYRQTSISRTFIRKVFNGYVPTDSHHLELPKNQVKKIINLSNYDGWFFDLETESGTFHAGAGNGVVHNSPRRGENFVTRKITKWIGEFYKWSNQLRDLRMHEQGQGMYEALQFQADNPDRIYKSNLDNEGFPKLRLGNLDAFRDWGHAKDYVEAMWLMLQQDKSDDYVIATGETHSVRDFLDVAFAEIGINDWQHLVVIDPEFFRPAEVDFLLGNSSKAYKKLGWRAKTKFNELVSEMVWSDVEKA